MGDTVMSKELDTIKSYLVDKKGYKINHEGEGKTKVKSNQIAVLTENYVMIFTKSESDDKADEKKEESKDEESSKDKVPFELDFDSDIEIEGKVVKIDDTNKPLVEVIVETNYGGISMFVPATNLAKGDKLNITINKV